MSLPVTRRQFVRAGLRLSLLAAGVVGVSSCSPSSAASSPAPARLPRIGYLAVGPPPPGSAQNHEAFLEGLQALGYTVGENLVVEYRWVTAGHDQYAEFTAELLRDGVDLIVASGVLAAQAVKSATTQIPIVMVNVGDAVATGLVASLAHPGGNITGVSTLTPPLTGKRVELLRELVPSLSRVAVLGNPNVPDKARDWEEARAAMQDLGLEAILLPLEEPDELENAFAVARQKNADALIVLNDDVTFIYRRRIAELALQSQLPAIYPHSRFTEAGGLLSYGPNIPDLHRRAAYYVDRILKGTAPADLPVEQPREFELVINLKSAEALGLTIPQPLLLRTNSVIR